jgi:hypothetical protein
VASVWPDVGQAELAAHRGNACCDRVTLLAGIGNDKSHVGLKRRPRACCRSNFGEKRDQECGVSISLSRGFRRAGRLP